MAPAADSSRPERDELAWTDPVQCQGCGHVSYTAKVNDPHNCWRNLDGTYEEGGTYQ